MRERKEGGVVRGMGGRELRRGREIRWGSDEEVGQMVRR